MLLTATLATLLGVSAVSLTLRTIAFRRLARKHDVLREGYESATAEIIALQDRLAVREYQVDRLAAHAGAHESYRAMKSVQELIASVSPSGSEGQDEWDMISRPLQQVVIRLQGTWRSEPPAIFSQLDIVRARLENGHRAGHEHDDDFGYEFAFEPASQASSFFLTPVGRR